MEDVKTNEEAILLADIVDTSNAVEFNGDISEEELFEQFSKGYQKALINENTVPIERKHAVRMYVLENKGEGDFDDFCAKGYNTYNEPDPQYWEKVFKWYASHKEKAEEDEKAHPMKGGRAAAQIPAQPVRKMSAEEIESSEEVDDDFKFMASAISKAATGSGESIKEIVDMKFGRLESLTKRIARGRSSKKFALIYGDGGIGKTFSIKKALSDIGYKEVKEGAALDNDEYAYARGDIGTALSDIAAFFFEHRNDNLLVLDDCDAFMKKNAGQRIGNMLKAMLDSDPEVSSESGRYGNFVKVGYETAKGANRKLASAMSEGIYFKVNKNKLREGKVEITINGETFSESASKKDIENTFGKLSMEESFDTLNVLNVRKRLHEGLFDSAAMDDDDDVLINDDIEGDSGDEMLGNFSDQIQNGFWFCAPIIFISNLTRDDIFEPVLTRCDAVPLQLTPDEFIARCEEVAPHIKVATASNLTEDEKTFAKKQAIGAIKLCIQSAKKNIPLVAGEGAVRIAIPLQFRIINDLVGSYCMLKDEWLESIGNPTEEFNKLKASTKDSRLLKKIEALGKSPDIEEIAALFIQAKFIKYYVIPYMEDRSL